MSAAFSTELLAWYDREADPLPWRNTTDPYRVWLAEIMLQQTQVDTVIPYYTRFLETYPDAETLAAAPLDDVLKQWEGLGYYSRARHLHRTARIIAAEMGGEFPTSAAALQKLPGIGRYTAGAIASIAFGEGVAVVDGNVIRVFARLLDLADDVTQSSTQRRLWQWAAEWLPEERPGDYNQALMELGRRICSPRNPLCQECPLQAHCRARANGTQLERPVKAKNPPLPHYDVAAGIIRDAAGRILITQRPFDDRLGGLWEFPGGQQEAGETLPETLRRELREELGIEVAVGELFVAVKHAFSHFKITLHVFECRLTGGEPQKLGVQNFAWVTPDEFDHYSFGKADRMVIAALDERGRMLF